jgi:hypothetical protein
MLEFILSIVFWFFVLYEVDKWCREKFYENLEKKRRQ